jgi:hypothetical protein
MQPNQSWPDRGKLFRHGRAAAAEEVDGFDFGKHAAAMMAKSGTQESGRLSEAASASEDHSLARSGQHLTSVSFTPKA